MFKEKYNNLSSVHHVLMSYGTYKGLQNGLQSQLKRVEKRSALA